MNMLFINNNTSMQTAHSAMHAFTCVEFVFAPTHIMDNYGVVLRHRQAGRVRPGWFGMADSEPPSHRPTYLFSPCPISPSLLSAAFFPSLLHFLLLLVSLTPGYRFHGLASPSLPCGVSIWRSETEGQRGYEEVRLFFHKHKGAKSTLVFHNQHSDPQLYLFCSF